MAGGEPSSIQGSTDGCSQAGRLRHDARGRYTVGMLVSQRINRERVVVLGWGRAILLQLAHPMVAAGVAEHSGFAGSRWARLQRLHATVGAMVELSFGDEAQRAADGRAHQRDPRARARAAAGRRGPLPGRHALHGHRPRAAALGARHAARLDPAGLRAVRRARSRPRRRTGTARSRGRPHGCCGFRTRWLLDARRGRRALRSRTAVSDGTLAVGPQARRVARQLLYPPLSDPTRPAAWLTRLVTLGPLPPAIRAAYGFPWSPRPRPQPADRLGARSAGCCRSCRPVAVLAGVPA